MSFFPSILNKFRGFRDIAISTIGYLLTVLSLFGLAVMIYEIGFPISDELKKSVLIFYELLIKGFLTLVLIRFLLSLTLKHKLTTVITEWVMIASFIFLLVVRGSMEDWISAHIPLPKFLDHILITYLIVSTAFVIEISRNALAISNLNFSPALLFVLSFFIIILAGTGLLLLPNSTNNGISVVDAFFISTSAVCVTGLCSVNISTEFTGLGKFFLIMLFQVGGLGIMTFTSFFAYFFSGGYSVENRLVLKDLVNTDNMNEIFKTVIKIISLTLVIELIGGVLIFWVTESPFPDAIARGKFAIFHAVSAYCHAGFSTLPDGFYEPSVRTNYSLHLIAALLILIGSIGFPIVFNFYTLGKYKILRFAASALGIKKPEYQSHIINVNTKIVLITTAALVVFGFVAFYVAEFNNSLKDLPLHGKIITSIFGSITPRSGGLSTIDMSSITPALILIYLLLMWIGGSPSSTAGGIKTSTFAVAVLNIVNLAKGRQRIEIFKREIPTEAIKRSYAVISLSLLCIGLGVFLITIFEPQLNLTSVAFECFSAYSTVGLSLGITPELSTASKYVIIALMFVGRVSVLTFVFMFIKRRKFHRYRYPSDNILIT